MTSRDPSLTSARACLSVVVPCYNEETTVQEVLRNVLESPFTAEVVAVDDCSTDSTLALLEELQADVGPDRLKIIRQDRNRGKGAALRLGFRAVTAPYVIVQDADLEYDPAEYDIVLGPLLADKADVVYGSRFHSNRPHRVLYYWHSAGNKLLTILSNMSTNLNLSDMETCYKAFRRDLIQSIDIEEDRFGFEPEVTAKLAAAGARVYEVGISYDGRTYEDGKKIGWRDGVRALYCIARYSPLLRGDRTDRHDPPRDLPVDVDPDMAATLDRLDDAGNYANWLGDLISPHVRGRVVEVGAGIGTLTERIHGRAQELTSVEPAPSLSHELKSRFADQPQIEVVQGDLASVADLQNCDTVILVNVLEHIEDDGEALRQIHSMLAPGGKVILYVPAFQALYSEFDRKIGHHRRYRKRELGRRLRSAGYQIDELRHVNSIGFGLWWFGVKTLGQDPGSSPATTLYDRAVVPWQRAIEDRAQPPVGQSLLAVATRSLLDD
ncbi:MAG: glycosyltransferase [Actinomycetia bacterium]|nr:glycosyltransferase [Actinomycetes bacterium]